MEKPHQDTKHFEEYLFSQGARAILSVSPRYVPPMPVGRGLTQAATISSPIKEVMKTLVESIISQVVLPSLMAATQEEYFQIISTNWHELKETVKALHVIVARVSSEERAIAFADRAAEANVEELAKAAQDLAGPDAVEEVKFATQTYLSALRLIRRFDNMPKPKDIETDVTLCRVFETNAVLHEIGAASILAATSVRVTDAGIGSAFDLLRSGAMSAYAAAREAYDLRAPIDETPDSLLPFDDEDVRLTDADL